jgi:tetratricopeptide (TPR) repeat protein
VQAALGPIAFLDTEEIVPGDAIPHRIIEGLSQSRVVVVFASEAYFRSPYCLHELRLALSSDRSLSGIVIALPSAPSANLLRNFPPSLRQVAWPASDDSDGIVRMVREKLENASELLGPIDTWAADAPRPLTAPHHPASLPPSLHERFVGRADELWRLHAELALGTAAAVATSVEGGAGFGKTRFVLEYVHRFNDAYQGGIFWVDAEHTLTPQLHGILRALRPNTPTLAAFLASKRDVRAETAESLAAVTERILYVIDNVPEPDARFGAPQLDQWCPAIDRVSLIATSRFRMSLGVPFLIGIDLDVLAPLSARQLLTWGVETGALHVKQWSVIADSVGRLPVVLELMNVGLRTGALTPAELLEAATKPLTATELDRQYNAVAPFVPATTARRITHMIGVSAARLSEAARASAMKIAQLAPAAAPLDLLDAVGAGPAPRAELLAHSFVSAAATPSSMLGAMHRVIAAWFRSIVPDERTLIATMQSALDELGTHLTPRSFFATRPGLEAYAAHMRHFFERAATVLPTIETVSFGCMLVRLLGADKSEEAGVVAIRTHLLAEQLLPKGNELWYVSIVNYATALGNAGRHSEAVEILDRARRSTRWKLSKDPRVEAEIHAHLAIQLTHVGRIAEAMKRFETAVQYARQLPDGVIDAAKLLSDYAQTAVLAGDARAGELMRAAIGSAVHLSTGRDDPAMLAILARGGFLLAENGQPLAVEQYIDMLADLDRVFGSDDALTLRAKFSLGSVLHQFGRHEEAEATLMEVIETAAAVDNLNILGSAMTQLVSVLLSLDDASRALAVAERAMPVVEKVWGRRNVHGMQAAWVLARALAANDDVAAFDLFWEVLRFMGDTLGPSHPNTFAVMDSYANAMIDSNRYAGAAQILRQHLLLRRLTFGTRDPSTTRVAATLYHVYLALEESKQAAKVWRKYLAWLLAAEPGALDEIQVRARRSLLDGK